MSETVKRYGNDVRIEVPVFNGDGSPFDSSGADLRIEMRNGSVCTIPITEYEFSGNRLKFWVLASELKAVGNYDLFVEAKRNDPTVRGGRSTYTFDKRSIIKIEPHTR